MTTVLNPRANNIVPEGFGTAIPSNPAELLKFIQKQKQTKQNESQNHENLDIYQERIRKQEGEREKFELTQMGQEDVLSENLIALFKKYDQERLRKKIEKEIELRKIQEKLEREARQKAAEERRKAVVERIRKQQEEEERRKREAELEILRIEEEKLRKIEQEKARFLANQAQMTIEDQLSMLAEQDYREQLERKLWQQREREKILEWEREQKKKDLLEEEARKARMKELEEKKKKLELLRQQQQQQAPSADAMKEQGEKLNKQLRIQNRAKFVSKKIAANNTNAAAAAAVSEPIVEVINHNSSISQINNLFPPSQKEHSVPHSRVTTPRHELKKEDSASKIHSSLANTMKLHRHASRIDLDAVIFQPTPSNNGTITPNPNASSNVIPTASSSAQALHRQMSLKLSSTAHLQSAALDDALQKELADFMKRIQAIDSEVELKQIQSELMVKKREVRLEQRQRLTHKLDDTPQTTTTTAAGDGATVHTSLTDTMNDQMKQKLLLLTEKMNAVEKQLLEVQNQKNKSKILHAEDETSKLTRQQSMKSSKQDLKSLQMNEMKNIGIAERDTKNQMHSIEEENESPMKPTIQQDSTELFKNCETVLRNANKSIVTHSYLLTDDLLSIKSSSLFHEAINEMSSITFEIMKYQQMIIKDYDPLGYGEKLHQMNDSLKKQIEQLQQRDLQRKEKEKELGSLSARVSPRPTSAGVRRPVRIYSQTKMAEEKAVSATTTTVEAPTSNKSSLIESKPAPSIEPSPPQSELKLMASSSEPVFPTISQIAEEKKSFPPTADENSEKIISITKENMNEQLTPTETSDNKGDDEVKGNEDDQPAEINPADLPGWEECIYTSMFSAAHHAAFFGYYEVLKFLCKYFDCFIMDNKQRTPLFYASLNNRLDCVALLLELDPQWIDVGDEKGDTALHAAAISNSVQILAFLLSCEAHPDTANYVGLTPSHLARSKDALILLQDSGAQLYCVDNLSRTPLWYACSDGRIDCCEYLCEKTPGEFLLWKDNEGESPLHIAATKGHYQCIDLVCQYILTLEELNITNNRKYTAAHLANNANVLQILYENGANLWIPDDNKGRMPLFIASFFGRADCVSFLLELAHKKQQTMANLQINEPNKRKSQQKLGSIGSAASANSLTLSSNNSSVFTPYSPRNTPTAGGEISPRSSSQSNLSSPIHDQIAFQDKQGDTALHVAALCGHMSCVHLLLFYISGKLRNKQNLTPSDLAYKAKHHQIGQLIELIENYKETNLSYSEIFGTNDFHFFSSILLYYGSRWGKCYDLHFQTYYYIDYVTNQSQWERPELLDIPHQDEESYTTANELLVQFYTKYNPSKLNEINMILFNYRNQYSNLFITLANKYQIQDLSMFSGINFDK